MLFISASVIGIMFIVGKFLGNESFKNEIASLFSDLYLCNFSEVVKNSYYRHLPLLFDLLVLPWSQVKKGLAQLDAFFQSYSS